MNFCIKTIQKFKMYQIYQEQNQFPFLEKLVDGPVQPATLLTRASDDFQEQPIEKIGSLLRERLINELGDKLEVGIAKISERWLRDNLKSEIQKCVEKNVQPDWQSVIFENFSQLVPNLTLLSSEIPIIFSKDREANYESRINKDLKREFWKLLPLIIREKLNPEVIINIATFQQGFQRELSKSEIMSCVETIRQCCENVEILTIAQEIESLLKNYTPEKTLTQSIRFSIRNRALKPLSKNSSQSEASEFENSLDRVFSDEYAP